MPDKLLFVGVSLRPAIRQRTIERSSDAWFFEVTLVDKTTDDHVLISQAEVDIQSLVTMLRGTAEAMVSDEESMPLGAISLRGELVLEYVPPAESSLERRKLLHRKLVGIAKLPLLLLLP